MLALAVVSGCHTGRDHLWLLLDREYFFVEALLATLWSTNALRPPTTKNCPGSSPITPAWICSALTRSATRNSIPTERDCRSRSSNACSSSANLLLPSSAAPPTSVHNFSCPGYQGLLPSSVLDAETSSAARYASPSAGRRPLPAKYPAAPCPEIPIAAPPEA